MFGLFSGQEEGSVTDVLVNCNFEDMHGNQITEGKFVHGTWADTSNSNSCNSLAFTKYIDSQYRDFTKMTSLGLCE